MMLLTPAEMRYGREVRHQLWLEAYRRQQRRTAWLGLVYWGIWVAVLAILCAVVLR